MENKNWFQKLTAFCLNVIKSDSKESSKRVMAIYTLLALITYIVIRFTDNTNAVTMVITLCSFILTLSGYGVWQSIKLNKDK